MAVTGTTTISLNPEYKRMFLKKNYLTTGLLLLVCAFVLSQDKLVIDDRAGLMDPVTDQLLSSRFALNDLTYVTSVDFRNRCEYWYVVLDSAGQGVFMEILDCFDRSLGIRDLGSSMGELNNQDKTFLLSYFILDIMDSALTEQPEDASAPGQAESAVNEELPRATTSGSITNEHDTRYFFAPAAYNLKKGQLYYNTIYFFLHDIQYGISDHFSFGMGTSLIGLPVYFTPKFSIPTGERSALALGDLLIFGTYGTNAIGNLAYGNFTIGGPLGNFSIGGGYLATNESELTGRTSSGVFNISGMRSISPRIYLLTENYFFGIQTRQSAWQEFYDESTNFYDYIEENFNQRMRIWYGIAGFRFISKKTDFVSWQVGLTYVGMIPGVIPEPYKSMPWNVSAPEDLNMIAFPTVSYTRKFGRTY